MVRINMDALGRQALAKVDQQDAMLADKRQDIDVASSCSTSASTCTCQQQASCSCSRCQRRVSHPGCSMELVTEIAKGKDSATVAALDDQKLPKDPACPSAYCNSSPSNSTTCSLFSAQSTAHSAGSGAPDPTADVVNNARPAAAQSVVSSMDSEPARGQQPAVTSQDETRSDIHEVAMPPPLLLRALKAEEVLKHRRVAEEESRHAAEATHREAQREEQARRQQEALERETLAKEAKKLQDKRCVECFLLSNGFPKNDANGKRNRIMRGYCRPLHESVKQNNAAMVELLLNANSGLCHVAPADKCAADPSLKNSAGLTPLQLSRKLDKKGSHAALIALLEANACCTRDDHALRDGKLEAFSTSHDL